jgi:ubiquinone/menaquinone biosynthesis C-methylase UbiE
MADIAALKRTTREAWSKGNYAELAKLLEPAAREMVDACAISAGQEVLDVAAGNGNVALLAAREGARVVACDITPAMVELGRARAAEEGLDVEWLVADAEELPFDDARFDCVTSVFGAIFAPRPELVARELFRVVRPGGTVGLTAWTPDGYTGQSFAISREYLPLPDGVPPAADWGDEQTVRARLAGLAARIELGRRTVALEFDSPKAMSRFFARNAGPAIASREQLPPERYEEMSERGNALAARHNRATDGSVSIASEYLLIVARRRG